MEMQAIKAAFIKRGRSFTSLAGGRLKIYSDVSILHPNNQSELIRNAMFSDYLDSKFELRRPYRIFVVPFIIPVLLFQNGFFIGRKVNCIFALYDGSNMREDIKNTLASLRAYRVNVVIAALAICALAAFISTLGGGYKFFSIMLGSWFGMVIIFAMFFSTERIRQEMEDLVDLDRNNWGAPDLPKVNRSERNPMAP